MHSKLLVTMIVCFRLLPNADAQKDATAQLRSLAEQSHEYQRSIPNFTCSEVVTTTAKRGDKLDKRIEFQADVRVLRKEDHSLDETFLITNYMGKATPNGGKFSLPLYMSGGLSEGMPSFFEGEKQACYVYDAAGERIDFRSRDGQPQCKEISGTTGFATLDAQGKLLHGELHRPPAEASKKGVASRADIDYGDVTLNGRTFRMPTHVYGEILRGGTVLTFDAFYTSCKLFAAKTTIRVGDGAGETPSP